jgi:AcrR family transcriptional regulator
LELNSIYVKMSSVTTGRQRGERRTDALSKDRIVEAAIDILDVEGERAQLFRALTTRLSTGVGAIYHHVANKSELLAAAADVIISRVSDELVDSHPRDAIRSLSLGIFDAIDAHAWVGAQLTRDPSQPGVLRIWSAVGVQLDALGVPESARSDAGSALVNYILGAAAQYAAGPGRQLDPAERAAILEQIADRWQQADSAASAESVTSLREHDDRQQFLAGVDIFLAGIASLR